jgi:hypothetical protein
MRSEEQTPVDQRFLWLEGFVAPSTLDIIKEGLGTNVASGTVVCFVGFSYADLAIPKQYDVVFNVDDPSQCCETETRIIRVTQQLGKPFDEIPHGWKTICVVEFPSGMPSLVAKMPTVDSWYKSEVRVGLCEKHVWEAVAAGLKSRDLPHTDHSS